MASYFIRSSARRRGPILIGATLIGLTILLGSALSGCAGGLTSTPEAAQPGSPSLNGCQTQQAPTNLAPADVALTGAGSSSTPTSDFTTKGSMKQGQTLDIHLAATVKWQMTTSPSSSILQVMEPQSWYDAQDSTCVWRMQGAGAGNTEVDYTGPLVCPPSGACPAVAAIARFNITVS